MKENGKIVECLYMYLDSVDLLTLKKLDGRAVGYELLQGYSCWSVGFGLHLNRWGKS